MGGASGNGRKARAVTAHRGAGIAALPCRTTLAARLPHLTAGLRLHSPALATTLLTCSLRRAACGQRREAAALQQLQRLFRVRQVRRIGKAHQHHVGSRQRLGRGLNFGNALQQDLPGPRQGAHRKLFGKFPPAQALGLGDGDFLTRLGHDLEPGHQMGEIGKIRQHHGRVCANGILPGQLFHRFGNAAGHEMAKKVDHPRPVGKTQHLPYLTGIDVTATMGNRLIQQRQAVTRRALARTGDQRQRIIGNINRFGIGNAPQQANELGLLDAAQVKALAAGQHRHRDLADFRGGENELHMLRRLFQRLQQAVEGRVGEHVHFVDDVDLVARRSRAVTRCVRDLADIVDAGVRGGVHLDHIDMTAFHDGAAMGALAGELHRRALHLAGDLIVEAARQNTGRGRLADTAHAGQHPGLRNAPRCKGVFQRLDHRLLADEIVKGLGAVLAGQHPVGAGLLPFASRRRCGSRRGRFSRSIAEHGDRQIIPLMLSNLIKAVASGAVTVHAAHPARLSPS